ncbi:MAG: hypothetical protein UX10_C0004G0035 [Candidatus Magasanikbacteria bacterium GW2011_GWA2_45_39]|uniref:DUF5666 domain-containing protein n=1 Tax=Candidatus Magasanikbacteria bacterium GW2011_GWA2_45_39 TaxID=1619041 RepID=A0A0G1MII9_9BACT|nr:MAG: hypothetical protein UX10_C0004G0035 [Candidatus Magasanikbacteria bacterium GW2011_GWA2_45_39]HBW74168.1 hypothetical protein [Candidatus Magasanikbacteria bacterium]
MNFRNIFKSSAFVWITWMVAALILLLLVFKLGIMVGARKAEFSYRWSDNYHRNFGGPTRSGFFRGLGDKDFMQGSGITGGIIKIDGQTIVIKGSDGVEKTVVVTDQTLIKRARKTLALTDLKVDDELVVIGAPNSAGQTEAKFIRVFDKSSK